MSIPPPLPSSENSKLTTCKDCGGQVSKKAKKCTICGAPVAKSYSGCLVVIVMFIVAFVWFCMSSLTTSTPAATHAPAVVIEAELESSPTPAQTPAQTLVKPPKKISSRQAKQAQLNDQTIKTRTAHKANGLNMAAYKRIKAGMTYKEVVRIIGEQGEESSRVEIEGIPVTILYMWKQKGFMSMGNMNATFQGDKLTVKAQFGLK